jgi:hypothetical protein
MSSLPPIEGTVSAKPFHPAHGTVSGSPHTPRSGTLRAPCPGGSVSGDAIANVGDLISSLGSLSAQAQSLPLTPPTLPGLPQQNYRPQATDYTQFVDESN